MSSIVSILLLCQSASVDSREAQLLATFKSICWIESKHDPKAFRKSENAAGVAQIRPIMVKDCNRIKGGSSFTLEDRWSPVKSYEMFRTHSLNYWPSGGPEQWSRGWNGGSNWKKNPKATDRYWHNVQAAMKGN